MPAHEYHHPLTGQPVPSTSTVIGQLKSSFRSAQIEAAAELGTLAHDLIRRTFAGEAVDLEQVPEDVARPFAAFQRWVFDRDPVVERTPDGRVASELSLVTPPAMGSYMWGGQLDIVVRIGARRVVVDAKNRSADEAGHLPTPDRHALTQIGSYGLLWEMTYPQLPLTGGLVLILGRNAEVYRECWLTRPQLECRMREFLALRTALAEHEAGKVELKASRRADRAAAKAGRAA